MKKLSAIAVVAVALLCTTGAYAVTISYNTGGVGCTDDIGGYLQGTFMGGDLVQLLDAGADGVPNDIIGPTVAPIGDDVVIHTTHIGAGFGSTNGNFNAALNTTEVSPGDKIFFRVFDDAAPGPGNYYQNSQVVSVKDPLSGDTSLVDGGLQTTIPLVPEPSMLIAGLALLLLRKKK
jgi:hypothetical protein